MPPDERGTNSSILGGKPQDKPDPRCFKASAEPCAASSAYKRFDPSLPIKMQIRNRDQPPDDPYRVDDAALRKAINAGRDARRSDNRRVFIVILLMLFLIGAYKANEAFQGFQTAQQQEAAAKQRAAEQEAAAKHEVSLQTLKKTDVLAYLAALKKDNDSRWESEFKVLDPRGYEAARKTEIANLMLELKNGAQDADRFIPIYIG